MKLKQLRRCHPDYSRSLLQMHSDLFAGGEQFQKHIRHYLLRNDVEPENVYVRRCTQANYLNYCAPIINFFASYLFTCPMRLNALDNNDRPTEADPFYAAFKKNCDSTGTDFDQFLREQIVQSMIHLSSWCKVQFAIPTNAPSTIREWEQSGSGEARVVAVPTEHITNWRKDEAGNFEWLVEHSCKQELVHFEDEQLTNVETWTLWRADGSASCWELRWLDGTEKPNAETDVPEIDPPHNPTGVIPFIDLTLPRELWVMNLLAQGQLEHFRKHNALSWAIDRTCYAMPWFFLKDRKRPPAMGTGYYGILGTDEKIEWPAPPSVPFEQVSKYTTKQREELYRITHQMAAAVDNNAAAVGRSGESKQADNSATTIVLQAIGRHARECAERILNLLALGRGESEGLRWSVGGMDQFNISDNQLLVDVAVKTNSLGIPSVTFKRELYKRIALSQLPDIDEGTRQAIGQEIDRNIAEGDIEDDSEELSEGSSDSKDTANTERDLPS